MVHQTFYVPPISWWKESFQSHLHQHLQMLSSSKCLFKYSGTAVWLILWVVISSSGSRYTCALQKAGSSKDLTSKKKPKIMSYVDTHDLNTERTTKGKGGRASHLVHTVGVWRRSTWMKFLGMCQDRNTIADWRSLSLSQSLGHQGCLNLSCTQSEAGALWRGRWSYGGSSEAEASALLGTVPFPPLSI